MSDDYVSMSESSRRAFYEALVKLSRWRLGEPEPEVGLDGNYFPIGTVFEVMTKFDQDKMPDDLMLLTRNIFDETGAAERFNIDRAPTYGNAANILARRVVERKAEFERREEARRNT
jgi:hypothetical protein